MFSVLGDHLGLWGIIVVLKDAARPRVRIMVKGHEPCIMIRIKGNFSRHAAGISLVLRHMSVG